MSRMIMCCAHRSVLALFALALALGAIGIGGCGDDNDHPARTATPTAVPTVQPTPLGNRPPVLAPIGDRTVAAGTDLLIALSATDPDGQEVTFSASGLPSDSYFLPTSAVFCVLPGADNIGQSFQATFTASDGELTDSETVTITVVRAASGGVGTGGESGLVLAPIGDQSVRAGETLTLQLAASGTSPIAYRMYPEAAIAQQVTLDATSGLFHFTPTAAQLGGSFEITFQACIPDGVGCSAAAQVHETIHISVGPAGVACPDYVPGGCTELTTISTLPQPVKGCFVIRQGGADPYLYNDVNILAGGAVYFVEDPAQTIEVRVKSLLVEQGGVLQAGSPICPFGAQGPKKGMPSGRLSIALYGDDPSAQGTIPNPPPGIQCLTSPGSAEPCFPAGRLDPPTTDSYYCTVSGSDDPCSSTTAPADNADNFQLEHYGNLNFDPTPWGYKVLGVSYGGSLRLFGYKGAKPLQDQAFAAQADPAGHCAAPTAAQSTLDAAEMQDWADLTGSSWARLQASTTAGGKTVLTLDRLAPDWTVGDEIVVGTTDWYPSHSELRTVTNVGTRADGKATTLTVDVLQYPHVSEIFDAKALEKDHGAEYTGPVNRTAADLRAVVELISRNIQIRSLGVNSGDEFPAVDKCLSTMPADPNCYFGGHVIVRQGFREAQIQGVEFKQLGQGGRMGHYPMHFHLAKNTAYTQGKAFVKDSSIWDSMTRFITVHGTHNVTLARNVGYLSVGHGFYLEDGSEIENLLCQNLGVSARGALTEFYAAQAAVKPPSLLARAVPPILDGSNAAPTLPACNPPCPPETEPINCPKEPKLPCGPDLRTGSDSYMPVMFWAMNADNEFVGNAAIGVHGFGSCYWLLGSGVSGPSHGEHKFAGYANYNIAGGYQAPLLRFRGNSCGTAPLALPASAELPPAGLGDATNTGFTPVANPYIANKLFSQLQGNYDRPSVVGNFQPIPIESAAKTCASVSQSDAGLQNNVEACVTTVLDRFTTSFNWAQVNFGSVWLRPWFYLYLNGAMTDQLFGGITFVSAGSWLQAPPGYFSLAKNSLFVGTAQHGGSQFAQRTGPIFSVSASSNLGNYGPCSKAGRTTCNIDEEGAGYWQGSVQPKRLINIYDGPHYADGNLFVNIGSFECDPQPCKGKQSGQCTANFGCGIYSSTTQPASPTDPSKMVVLDAPIGWKQPNGFYYPPAFTYRASHFFKKLPTGLPDPDPSNPLNQCLSFGAANNFMGPTELPGSCRHNTLDRTATYLTGNMQALAAPPTVNPPNTDSLSLTPIDFSTIIIDLDASLTGASGQISGVNGPVPTTSISRNAFFDAPAQSDECLSFGVQTSPYQFVTSVVAPLHAAPAAGETYIEPWTYQRQPDNKTVGTSPVLAIYRQWMTANDEATCEQVCDKTDQKKYGCGRATFMVGPDVGQAPYLTMTQPPGLMGQKGASYYIDTSSAQLQSLTCLGRGRTNAMQPAPFNANGSYIVFDLFARNDAVSSYQFFVGDNVNGLSAIQGRYVRIDPHVTSDDNTNGLSSFRSLVTMPCDPDNSAGQWCAGLPKPTVTNGILSVMLDQRPIAADFEVSARQDYARCMPRDFCYFDSTTKGCKFCDGSASCNTRQSVLPIDVPSMNAPDATGSSPLDVVCQDWVTYTSGTKSAVLSQVSLADCPAGGCLGFAFTLPGSFMPNKTYADVASKLSHCFSQSSWMDDALVERQSMNKPADPLCGAPRMAMASDFCVDPASLTQESPDDADLSDP